MRHLRATRGCLSGDWLVNFLRPSDGGYVPRTPTIDHYDEDYLVKAIRSVVKRGYEYQRNHVVGEVAEYLGFDRVSSAFLDRMKSVFRMAIRRGQIHRDGGHTGKV